MRTGWNTRPEVPERAQTCAAGAGNPCRAQPELNRSSTGAQTGARPGIEPELNRGSNQETGKHTNTAWTSFKRTPRVWMAAGARCLSPLRAFPPKTSQTGGGSGHHMVIRRSHTTAGTSYGRFRVRYYTHGDVTKGGESGHRHGELLAGRRQRARGLMHHQPVVGWEGNRRPRTSWRGCVRVPENDRKACPGPGSPDRQDRNRRPQHWSQANRMRNGVRGSDARSAGVHACFWRSRKDPGERYGPDGSLGGAAMTGEVCEHAGTKPEQAKTSGAFRSSDRTLKQSPGAGVEREPVRGKYTFQTSLQRRRKEPDISIERTRRGRIGDEQRGGRAIPPSGLKTSTSTGDRDRSAANRNRKFARGGEEGERPPRSKIEQGVLMERTGASKAHPISTEAVDPSRSRQGKDWAGMERDEGNWWYETGGNRGGQGDSEGKRGRKEASTYGAATSAQPSQHQPIHLQPCRGHSHHTHATETSCKAQTLPVVEGGVGSAIGSQESGQKGDP
ncbi:hypothetical protein C8R47DRAFT_1063555 [Mycena vitilis]|nr:hypothetical protein C8R47DRAFT_1063555 [Mycena vitilis]